MNCRTYRRRYNRQLEDLPEPYEVDGELYFDEDEVERSDRILVAMGEHLGRCSKCQKWLAREGSRIMDRFSKLEADQSLQWASLPFPPLADLKRLAQMVSSEVRKVHERYKEKRN